MEGRALAGDDGPAGSTFPVYFIRKQRPAQGAAKKEESKTMNILVINAGSSSLKYQLLNPATGELLAKGLCERIGIDGKFTYKPQVEGKEKLDAIDVAMPTHAEAIQAVLDALVDPKNGVIASMDEIDAVGHRVVHGAETFACSVEISDAVMQALQDNIPLAPLHNPANIIGIEACKKCMPNVPMVGVFDTAFHQTMPAKAYMYALPYEMYEKYGIRRYGFHGTSHRYVSQRVCEYLGVDPAGKRIITCHVGNGGSISAVKDGKCIDTSMGLTPLEGLMMGTRSGDVDGGAVTFIMDKEGLAPSEMSNLLNKKSGVAGVTGVSSDMREVIAAAHEGNQRCRLALDMYAYRVKKYIGAYAAAMNGVDIILFTGGVGENQADMREAFCNGLDYLGVSLDKAKNNTVRGDEAIISTPDSKVTVCVIPTDEELMIAKDTMALV